MHKLFFKISVCFFYDLPVSLLQVTILDSSDMLESEI